MNTENIPQVGSKWTHDGVECDVSEVKKRGRGYQVGVTFRNSGDRATYRLRDFLKAAKPL